MAEGAQKNTYTSKILCRYFIHGVCRAADNCKYSHDMQGDKPSLVCRYYQKGCCTYGDRCRYDHTRPSSSSSSKSIQNSSHKPRSACKNSSTQTPCVKLVTPQDLPKDNFHMVTLKKGSTAAGSDTDIKSPTLKNPTDWVKAAEFVPGQTWKSSTLPSSYSAAAVSGAETTVEEIQPVVENTEDVICPFAAHGECRYGDQCAYHHGDICDLCGKAVLHKHNNKLRQEHEEECMKQHEKDMELSFAIQRSQKKACGICMDVVWEKEPASQRKFGIMSNCSHVFCLECIRKWRSAKSFENKIVRACPECRVKSDFVTPSKYWVEDKADKDELISGYKKALSVKNCKYFDQGKGECPFNENCFYLHAYPDGKKASPKPTRRRRRANADGDEELLRGLLLWDFLEVRGHDLSHLLEDDDISDLILHLNLLGWDSDDSSDDSEFDMYP